MTERKRAPLFATPAVARPQGAEFARAETGFDAHTGIVECDGMRVDQRERGDTGEAQPSAPRLQGGEERRRAGSEVEEARECVIVEMMEEEIRANCIERARLAQPIEDIHLFHTHDPSRTPQSAQCGFVDRWSAIDEEERRTVSIGECCEEILRGDHAITSPEFGNRPRRT